MGQSLRISLDYCLSFLWEVNPVGSSFFDGVGKEVMEDREMPRDDALTLTIRCAYRYSEQYESQAAYRSGKKYRCIAPSHDREARGNICYGMGGSNDSEIGRAHV